MRRFIGSLLALGCITASPVYANDEDKWWFDVEVLLFSRDASVSDLPELFERQQVLSAPKTEWDLLTAYYQPDITMVFNSLPVCDAPTSPLWAEAPDVDEILRDYYIEPEPEPISESEPTAAISETGADAEFAADTLDEASTEQALVDPLAMDTPVEIIEPEIIPPAPQAIAGYWLSAVLNEQALTPVSVKRPRLNCVTSRWPELDTSGDTWQWQQADLYIPPREQTPLYLHGADFERSDGPHLLSTKNLTLDDIYTSIRWRKGIDRLAHFSWRQQVKFGQEKAEKLRLFAGQNFARQFTQNGELRPQDKLDSAAPDANLDNSLAEPTDTFFAELNQRLINPQPISFAGMTAPPEIADDGAQQTASVRLAPIWELDGFIQVFLKYINRVPYLHINSELFYRQPVLAANNLPGTPPAYELVSIPFSQQRRVISTQLHYFDHPLFGMLVQIRRYDRPPAPQSDEETL
ncbi:CsiV family protein [Alteromonas lipolytica]|uniref:Peptidoglycan-binding protein CsiV n=1 Tax=Alteromonas lipolytica TaxID=1856405 RepID=A0A1E8FKE5_9ALTE|nr:CsiV family protein [Alteromonas lipolytica]OFI36421.1 hypothetical protein BFC17_00645 [Alteromonas lipolytica]GGF70036.1 hypothetical protein GCM10011338_22710 [Alteromonas lipolytica]